MKMDSDSGDGMMDGFLMCSSDTPGGIACLVEPSLDNASAASLLSLDTWWNSHPSKYPLICCTRKRELAIFASFASQVPVHCRTTKSESPKHSIFRMPISLASLIPCTRASY